MMYLSFGRSTNTQSHSVSWIVHIEQVTQKEVPIIQKKPKKQKKSKTGCVLNNYTFGCESPPEVSYIFSWGIPKLKPSFAIHLHPATPKHHTTKSAHPWGPEARGSEQHSVAWFQKNIDLCQSTLYKKRSWFVVLKKYRQNEKKRQKHLFFWGRRRGKG